MITSFVYYLRGSITQLNRQVIIFEYIVYYLLMIMAYFYCVFWLIFIEDFGR
jgi:hypothetical protein